MRFQYLVLGKELAEVGVSDFWPDDGHLTELKEGGLAPDQWSFKGYERTPLLPHEGTTRPIT